MELFHALNRGVDKRTIFLNDKDRLRFVHNLYEFNDSAPAPEFIKYRDFVNPDIGRSRDRIVDIHGWCLMDNHYHLLLSERQENGLSMFLRKLNVGYANYFNERYTRSGTLFQGRTKKVLVDNDSHFLYILHYLHLNPLDLTVNKKLWRQGHIRNCREALNQLETYRWSSYLDYSGKKNFPSVLTRDLFDGVFKNYPKELMRYVKDMSTPEIGPLTLE